MLAIRLPLDIETRLDNLAKSTGRTKTYYAREAILEYIDDLEEVMHITGETNYVELQKKGYDVLSYLKRKQEAFNLIIGE